MTLQEAAEHYVYELRVSQGKDTDLIDAKLDARGNFSEMFMEVQRIAFLLGAVWADIVYRHDDPAEIDRLRRDCDKQGESWLLQRKQKGLLF